MALIFMEGFECTPYGDAFYVTSPMEARWLTSGFYTSSSYAFGSQPGITSIGILVYQSWWRGILQIPITSKLYLGFYYWSSSSISLRMLNLTDQTATASPTTGIRLHRNEDGSLAFIDNTSGVILTSSPADTVVASAWYHLEVMAEFGSSGSLEIRVDGATVASAAGVDTRGGLSGAGYPNINFATASSSGYYVDHLYVCDDTGAKANDFLGPVLVYTLIPNADGTTNQMTPVGAATNWQSVSKTNSGSNSPYVTTDQANQVDLYNVHDLPVTPTAVHGVILSGRSQKSTIGHRDVRSKLKVGGDTVDGATHVCINGQYRRSQELYLTQPNGSDWDEAAINAMEIGFETL